MIGKQTRVLVVDDSITSRKRLVEALSADPELEVVGEAEDGARGIELAEVLAPDVITMDMVMPGVTGLAATEHIMAHCPTPILIVSGCLGRREARVTERALAAGAVDVLDKPAPGEPQGAWAGRLRAAVKMAARIRVIRHLRRRGAQRSEPRRARSGKELTHVMSPRIIAVGGSTGGPVAVASLLRALPADYPIPVLVVIHVSASFGPSLSEWLAGQSNLPVRVAVDGEPLPRSGVILAPADAHMLLSGGRVRLSDGPERHACRPSVDVLFESIARELGPRAIGCLLTGMGCDGAEGLLAMRRAGAETIAQDEATSRIYGMPKEAAIRGAAAHVLPIDAIAEALLRAASDHRACGGAP